MFCKQLAGVNHYLRSNNEIEGNGTAFIFLASDKVQQITIAGAFVQITRRYCRIGAVMGIEPTTTSRATNGAL
jgi:hypothetical protein